VSPPRDPDIHLATTAIVDSGALAQLQRQAPSAVTALWLIVRKTAGWHKWTDTLSLSQIAEGTGIPRPKVPAALARLEDAGLIRVDRRPAGNRITLTIPDAESRPHHQLAMQTRLDELATPRDHPANRGSNATLPVVTPRDHPRPQMVTPGDQQLATSRDPQLRERHVRERDLSPLPRAIEDALAQCRHTLGPPEGSAHAWPAPIHQLRTDHQDLDDETIARALVDAAEQTRSSPRCRNPTAYWLACAENECRHAHNEAELSRPPKPGRPQPHRSAPTPAGRLWDAAWEQLTESVGQAHLEILGRLEPTSLDHARLTLTPTSAWDRDWTQARLIPPIRSALQRAGADVDVTLADPPKQEATA
jgi:hypothetical protein